MSMSQIALFCRIALLFIAVTLVLAACGEQSSVPPAATNVINPGIATTTQITPVAGKPDTSNTTSGQLEACALVTQQEAEEALGSPSTVERHIATVMVFSECDYTVKQGEKRIRIELIVKGGNSYYTKTKKDVANYSPSDVAGLGDQAFKYSENEDSDFYLTVLKGDSVCRITVTNLKDNDKQATALMQKAVGRLTNGGTVPPTAQPAIKKTTPVAAIATTVTKSGSNAPSIAPVTVANSGSNGPEVVVHVCSLLTRDEAAIVLGGPVDQMEASADGANFPQGSGTCDYTNQGGGLTIKVNFTQLNKSDFEATMKDLNAEPVAGVGDAAFWVGNELTILKGTVDLVIFPLNLTMDAATTLDKAKAIAPQILGRLAKSPAAAALTTTAAPIKRTTATEVPVYPGAQLVKNEVNSFGTSSTYISTDNYTNITGWIKKSLRR